MCEFCGCGTGRSAGFEQVKTRGKRVPVRIVAEVRPADTPRAAARAAEPRPEQRLAAPTQLHCWQQLRRNVTL